MGFEEDLLVEPAAGAGGIGIDGKGQMPSMEDIMAMINSAPGISDEEKANIIEDVIKYSQEQQGILGDGAGAKLLSSAATAGGLFATQNVLFVLFVTIIALIIGFFVYKLIKTEKDKELSKELKRKAREERRNKKKKT